MPLKKASPAKKKPTKVSSTLNLARHLGLSEWTVSRAINGHPEVKAATRERILKAMDELGFRPNPVARGLSGKAMGIVGVCFGNPRNPLVTTKINLLDEFLREHGQRAILAINPWDEGSEIRILTDFRHLRVDAIVLFQSRLSTAQLRTLLDGIPTVLVEMGSIDLVPRVSLDRTEAMGRIVDHLMALGHRSFASIGLSSTNTWRWQGLADAMQRHGLSADRDVKVYELEKPGAESYGEGIELAGQFLRSPSPRPTALLAVNDPVAAGLMQGLRDAGYHIPNDFSVIGFDNLDVGRYLHPTLTTIDQQPHLLIRQAGEFLLQLLDKNPPSDLDNKVMIEPLLIARESTGPAPRNS